MMKIINLIKSEFIKNYNIKKFIVIFVVLLISSIGLVEFNCLVNSTNGRDYPVDHMVVQYNGLAKELAEKENRTLGEEYDFKIFMMYSDMFEYFSTKDRISQDDWRIDVGFEIVGMIMDNDMIDLVRNERDNPEVERICSLSGSESYFENRLNHYCNAFTKDELNNTYLINEKKIVDYKELLKEDKYYIYIKYQIDNDLIPTNDGFEQILIDKKIINNYDYLGINYDLYKGLFQNSSHTFVSREDFENDEYEFSYYINSYEDYLRYYKDLKERAIAGKEIILYSSINDIKHDISFNENEIRNEYIYTTSKHAVNQVLHLSIVVMILVAITSGGIVSSEHNNGTIKNIITAPVRRWKILLSKFIYLILHTYIIWGIGLLIISIYGGMRFGFSDLFSPKLIYMGGKVTEVNYYLYLLKDIFVASIPVICFLSILFCLSTVTLNTALTVGITTMLGVLSPVFWFLTSNLGFNFLVYTPFLYFDSGFIINNTYFYSMAFRNVDFGLNTGIIISLVLIVILYFVSNIIYIKRDIKT